MYLSIKQNLTNDICDNDARKPWIMSAMFYNSEGVERMDFDSRHCIYVIKSSRKYSAQIQSCVKIYNI